jgi:hypothetical protein
MSQSSIRFGRPVYHQGPNRTMVQMDLDTRTHQISFPKGVTMTEAEYVLVVPNPDDSFAMPIYEGSPTRAHEVLNPGRYQAFIEDWATDRQASLTVYVFDNSTVLGRYVFYGPRND